MVVSRHPFGTLRRRTRNHLACAVDLVDVLAVAADDDDDAAAVVVEAASVTSFAIVSK